MGDESYYDNRRNNNNNRNSKFANLENMGFEPYDKNSLTKGNNNNILPTGMNVEKMPATKNNDNRRDNIFKKPMPLNNKDYADRDIRINGMRGNDVIPSTMEPNNRNHKRPTDTDDLKEIYKRVVFNRENDKNIALANIGISPDNKLLVNNQLMERIIYNANNKMVYEYDGAEVKSDVRKVIEDFVINKYEMKNGLIGDRKRSNSDDIHVRRNVKIDPDDYVRKRNKDVNFAQFHGNCDNMSMDFAKELNIKSDPSFVEMSLRNIASKCINNMIGDTNLELNEKIEIQGSYQQAKLICVQTKNSHNIEHSHIQLMNLNEVEQMKEDLYDYITKDSILSESKFKSWLSFIAELRMVRDDKADVVFSLEVRDSENDLKDYPIIHICDSKYNRIINSLREIDIYNRLRGGVFSNNDETISRLDKQLNNLDITKNARDREYLSAYKKMDVIGRYRMMMELNYNKLVKEDKQNIENLGSIGLCEEMFSGIHSFALTLKAKKDILSIYDTFHNSLNEVGISLRHISDFNDTKGTTLDSLIFLCQQLPHLGMMKYPGYLSITNSNGYKSNKMLRIHANQIIGRILNWEILEHRFIYDVWSQLLCESLSIINISYEFNHEGCGLLFRKFIHSEEVRKRETNLTDLYNRCSVDGQELVTLTYENYYKQMMLEQQRGSNNATIMTPCFSLSLLTWTLSVAYALFTGYFN